MTVTELQELHRVYCKIGGRPTSSVHFTLEVSLRGCLQNAEFIVSLEVGPGKEVGSSAVLKFLG